MTNEFFSRNCYLAIMLQFLKNTPSKFIWAGTITESTLGREFSDRERKGYHCLLAADWMPSFIVTIVSFPVAIVNDSMDCYGSTKKGFFLFKKNLNFQRTMLYTQFSTLNLSSILTFKISWSIHAKLFY